MRRGKIRYCSQPRMRVRISILTDTVLDAEDITLDGEISQEAAASDVVEENTGVEDTPGTAVLAVHRRRFPDRPGEAEPGTDPGQKQGNAAGSNQQR